MNSSNLLPLWRWGHAGHSFLVESELPDSVSTCSSVVYVWMRSARVTAHYLPAASAENDMPIPVGSLQHRQYLKDC
jgi:hypothetical protein